MVEPARARPTQPRDRPTRKADALAILATPKRDGWVATATAAGAPYLVPLSLVWVEERLVLAIQRSSPTARNLAVSGSARVGAGGTRDVVMIDAVVERMVGVSEDSALGEAYAAQADWDPRGDTGYVFVILRPLRVQAWREADEIAGRTLMRDGEWLV